MTLDFAVRRRETELVGPARQMPRETKRMSDIETRWGCVGTCRSSSSTAAAGDNPTAVVRLTLRQVLVPYYPLALVEKLALVLRS